MTTPLAPGATPNAELLALVADRTHSAVIIADATGRVCWVNAGFTAVTGYAAEDIVGRRPGALLQGPATDPATVALMRAKIGAGEGFRTEVLNYGKSGTPYWLDIEVQPVRDPAGAVTHFIAIEQDITARKRADEQLARALSAQEAIINSTTALVVSTDAAGTVVTFNRAAELQLGYAAGEVVGRHTPALWHDPAELAARAREATARLGHQPAFPELFLSDAAAPTAQRWTFVRRDGTRFPGELTVTALRAADGRAIGYLGWAADITQRLEDEREQRELARRLAEQNAALEEQSRLAALRAEVGLALNQDAPLPDLLRGCCDAILRNTGAAFVRAWTLSAAEAVLELRASVGLYTHTDGPHARVPVGKFKIGLIAETRTPHLTNDVLTDPLVDRAWAEREGLVAFAGHPLVCDGQLVGVLALFARAALSGRVLATLEGVADAVAMGIARKRAEERVVTAQQRHRAVVESALDGIVTTDAAGRITEFNPAAERAFGFARDEVLGCELVQALIPPENREAYRAGLERYLSTGASDLVGSRAVGIPALRKDGSQFPAELSVVPIRTDGGRAFTAFFRDVTAEQAVEVKRREVKQQLQHAKEEAEAAARMQSEFLANMSHELRTPVAAVVGYAEMLLDPRLSAGERGKALQTIMRSGKHLTALINNVLDLSKIAAGRMGIEHCRTPLRRLVSEAVAQAEVGAREKNVDLVLVPSGRVPAVLTTDPTRLRQIIDNLLSNAVKFTDAGKRVELRLRLDAPADGAPRLLFEVEDQGIGIAPEGLARLFTPFTQADASTTRRYGGTGLGLSICKRLAQLLGGDISVRSAPAVGTCFSLALPVSVEELDELLDADDFSDATHSTLAPKAPVQKVAGRVLLAEDTPTIQAVIRYFLERAGLTVETVENGRAAVDRALAEEFDVILMDMQMPEMDGYAATSTLRQSGYRRSVLALTAHAMAGDEEKCLRAGCNGYLTKPVDPVKLIHAVARQITSRSWVVKYDAIRRPDTEVATPAAPPVPPQDSGPTTLERLTETYRRALPEKARAVGEALRERNLTRVTDLAHKLRGSAGMYGLPGVSEAAGRVEDACRSGHSVAHLAELIEALCAAAT